MKTFFINEFLLQMLNHIQQPEYRQLIVELLSVVATILARNPELTFNQPLDLRQLVEDAAHMYAKVCTVIFLFLRFINSHSNRITDYTMIA